MWDEEELRKTLHIGATLLVETSEGRLSLEDFLGRWGNFYYEHALDGHEATSDEERLLLQRYANVISLFEKVQYQVVDAVFVGEESQREMYLAAGRIEPTTASARLRDFAHEGDLDAISRQLA